MSSEVNIVGHTTIQQVSPLMFSFFIATLAVFGIIWTLVKLSKGKYSRLGY